MATSRNRFGAGDDAPSKTYLRVRRVSMLHESSGHVVYPKEMTRTRLGLEEWRPVMDKYTTILRYPIYPKGHFNQAPNKKMHLRQTAEQSEKVEVFSPAPPSILGSFSVFGHATLNGRQHASHIANKSPRPQQPAPAEHRPLHAYQLPHQKSHLALRYPPFEQAAYFYEASLRPPPRDHLADIQDRPHSASLAPNTYYFEQPQTFRSPASETAYHKSRKPLPKPLTAYREPAVYRPQAPLDPFRLSTPVPPRYDPAAVDFYDIKNPKINAPVRGALVQYERDPFGYPVHRPEAPVTEAPSDERFLAKDVFRQLSHLGRPFQNSPPSFSTARPDEEFQSFKPYVTTYSSASVGEGTKLASHPFRLQPNFETEPIVSSVKPNYFVTRRPYSEDSFSVTATTLVAPTEGTPGTEHSHKETFTESSFATSTGSDRPSPFTKDSGFRPSVQLPEVHLIPKQGYNGQAPFLPTPSTDTEVFVNGPTASDEPTPNPIQFNEISKKQKVSTQKEFVPSTEYFTEPVTTTEVTEVTTLRRRNPSKSRRRPVRPTEASTKPSGNTDDNIKNHKITDDVSPTVDYAKNRRRKPYDPHNRGGVFGSKNRHSEFKRHRTTTTTTPEPETYEATQYPFNEYSTFADSEEPHTQSQPGFDDRPEEAKEDFYHSTELTHYPETVPNNEVQLYGNDRYNNYYEEAPTTLPPTTSPPTTVVTTTTAPPPTTDPPVSSTSSPSNRFRNKYGNRPRFSVKDYRERLNRMTSTTSTTPSPKVEEGEKESETPKYSTRIRGSAQYKSATNGTDGTEQKQRKYKPRVGPSRYKFSTTTSTTTEATSERTNTFRPSTNRYKPGTGKYYSRYRTSSPPPKDDDRPTSTTQRTPIRPKGVFSAKRRPFPLKTKVANYEESNPEMTSHRVTDAPSFGSVKTVENEVYQPITKKIDDTATNPTTSAENFSYETESSDPTGAEAMRIADLTSSSSNEFESSGFLKGVGSSGRRTIPKITISTDDPILPLEAFFQTQNNRDKK
ncbi:hypothetical protein AAG570_007753 [Ranatra chinensis]|uniref:Uncharacterized protein n=1 Tax=Ranatra chinensis TaxID=642074 RepID=A0ABD0XWE1_9HEMI